MIVQTIHEWQEPWDCYVRKLGHGLVKAMFSGSVAANPSFLVQFYHTGQLRVVDMVDLVAYGNPSAGESLTPAIPEDWNVQVQEAFSRAHRKDVMCSRVGCAIPNSGVTCVHCERATLAGKRELMHFDEIIPPPPHWIPHCDLPGCGDTAGCHACTIHPS